MFHYASDPEVSRYTLWETHRSIENSRAFLELVLGKYERGEDPAVWGIVYKGDGRFVGTCATLGDQRRSCPRRVGVRDPPGVWGRGLAPEAVRAMIAFGFGRMGLNRIETRCIAEKTPRQRS